MSVLQLVQDKAKSGYCILECLRKAMKFVRNREVFLCAIVFIDRSSKTHVFKVGPGNLVQKDMMLEAIEDLHEDIYTDGVV